MSSATTAEPYVPTRSASPAAGWLLPIGGLLFFAGGMLHPNEDRPGARMAQKLLVMYVDPTWYPAHTLMLVGVACMATALVVLVRRRSLAVNFTAHKTAAVAAVAATMAVPATLLHLIAATDADRINDHLSTPPSDFLLIVETITAPGFGFSIAALALVGAVTRTLGSRVAAVFGVVGGIGYGLAGGTAIFTDLFDPLFPTAIGIAVWAIIAGIGWMRRPTASVTTGSRI